METAKNLLVVDDELPVCRSMANALAILGHHVEIALSGEEALKKDDAQHADVIIADLMMPGISGMELLKRLKSKRSDIIVIMVTGYPTIKSAIEAIKFGAFDYIPKPFTPDELRNMVTRALEMKRIMKETVAPDHIVVPGGLHFIPNNSWVKVESEKTVRVGVHHALVAGIKEIANVELPNKNQKRFQGEACAWITESTQRIRRVWTPITGTVISVNEEVLRKPALIISDPYDAGWLFEAIPLNLDADLKNLKTGEDPNRP